MVDLSIRISIDVDNIAFQKLPTMQFQALAAKDGSKSIASIYRSFDILKNQINMNVLTNHDAIHPIGFDLDAGAAAIFLPHSCGGSSADDIRDF